MKQVLITVILRMPLSILAVMELRTLGSSDFECFLLGTGMMIAYNFSLVPSQEEGEKQ